MRNDLYQVFTIPNANDSLTWFPWHGGETQKDILTFKLKKNIIWRNTNFHPERESNRRTGIAYTHHYTTTVVIGMFATKLMLQQPSSYFKVFRYVIKARLLQTYFQLWMVWFYSYIKKVNEIQVSQLSWSQKLLFLYISKMKYYPFLLLVI